MPDISIGDSAVTVSSTASKEVVVVAESVVPGDLLSYNTTNSNWELADADTSVESGSATDSYLRMAISGGAAGQWVTVVGAGETVTMDAVLTKGTVYYASTTAGAITTTAPSSGDYLVIVGYATSTTTLKLLLLSTGVVV